MSGWITRLAGVSLLCAAAMSIAPEGSCKKAFKMVCAFAMLWALLSGFTEFDWGLYSLDMQQYRQEGELFAQEGKEQAETATRLVIQRSCEAYILDKAQALGIAGCSCKVNARWSMEGYWTPFSCTISADCNERQKNSLVMWIEGELGIPAAAQTWLAYEDGGTQ